MLNCRFGWTILQQVSFQFLDLCALRVGEKYNKKEIAKMYEDNLRQLKSTGENTAADGTLPEPLGEIRVAA